VGSLAATGAPTGTAIAGALLVLCGAWLRRRRSV
jgi:MYXO-CTERM domain-containing protein